MTVESTPSPQASGEASRGVLVYGAVARATTLRRLLGLACRATGIPVRLELLGSGALFRRLRDERSEPGGDLVLTFGPYVAETAAREELLEPYQPRTWPEPAYRALPPLAAHEPEWRWVALDYLPFRTIGQPVADSLDRVDSAIVPRLALPDPARSEVGMLALLATLDRARKVERDPERGWDWWERRARAGLVLAEDAPGAEALVRDGRASHALVLPADGVSGDGALLSGLAPIPSAAGVIKGARQAEATRALLDWLVGPDGAAALEPQAGLDIRRAETNGLAALAASAPAFEVGWTFEQFRSVRGEWGRKGWK